MWRAPAIAGSRPWLRSTNPQFDRANNKSAGPQSAVLDGPGAHRRCHGMSHRVRVPGAQRSGRRLLRARVALPLPRALRELQLRARRSATDGVLVRRPFGARHRTESPRYGPIGRSVPGGTILLLSTLVAIRVDKERAARRASERLQRERELSEKKYRSLFENAGDAILVVDRDGNVQEANAAAERLGVDPARPEARITEQLGPNAAEIERFIRGEGDDAGDVSVTRPDGAEVWLQPVFATIEGVEHAELVQVLLRDVTDRHGFQHYVQEIVRAQEDERARIAHELHDVSVQSAILICRQLDEASSAVGADDGAAIGAMLIEARHSAEAMADELRRFSRDLRPLILEDLGFVPALRRLVNELRERSQIHLRCDIHGQPRRLDPPRRADAVPNWTGGSPQRRAPCVAVAHLAQPILRERCGSTACFRQRHGLRRAATDCTPQRREPRAAGNATTSPPRGRLVPGALQARRRHGRHGRSAGLSECRIR